MRHSALEAGGTTFIDIPDRAISVRQPYAWAITEANKDIENRTRPWRYRGWVLIHASLRWHLRKGEDFTDWHGLTHPAQLPVGGIVGMAQIVDCVDRHPSVWFEGPYGLVLRNQRPLPFVPCKGALGLFRVPPEVQEAVREACVQAGKCKVS